MTPPALIVPFTVSALPLKETAPPAPTAALITRLLPVKPSAPVSVVAPPIVVVPVPACCVRLAAVRLPVTVTSLAETIVTEPSANDAPTLPVKVTLPVPAVRERARAAPSLFTVLLNEIEPAPMPVVMARSLVRTTGPVRLTVPPEIATLSTARPALMSPAMRMSAPCSDTLPAAAPDP